jgi:hypothetical protein
MWRTFSVSVDLIHAALMVVWVVGLPLLFIHRWPRLSRASALYCAVFILLSQGSQLLLGECFFTTIARWCWEHAARDGAAPPASAEWFTVRLARAVFRLSPSHHAITRAFELLALVAAVGVLTSFVRTRRSVGALHHG